MKVQVKTSLKEQRVATHSHIQGLGLNEDGSAKPISQGFVGQEQAREACGIIVEMIQSKKMAGRTILITGPPATGKTALAYAISKELGQKVPFCPMVGNEIDSNEVKKTEILMENFRRSIHLKIKDFKEIFEGEITDLQIVETENFYGNFEKKVAHLLITLKSTLDSKQLKLDSTIYESILKQNIEVGDVVLIEVDSGSIKRLGRLEQSEKQFDLESDTFVPLPSGKIHKKKEMIQYVSLHELDLMNSQPNEMKNHASLLNLIGNFFHHKKTEITEKLRREVNKSVNSLIETGKAELIPGVLFIDEAHMLDLECFTFLNRALESNLSPVVILATNRGLSTIRGSDDIVAPHGIPSDLRDRLLMIRTSLYSKPEAKEILLIRSKIEKIQLHPDTLEHLSNIATEKSLRYAIQLLSPCHIISKQNLRDEILVEDLLLVSDLFYDAKTSVQLLASNQGEYLK